MQNNLIIAVLLGYILIGVGLMVTLKGVRGIMATIVIGWLFLPPGRGVNLPGIPQFTKEFSVAYALLLGVILTDAAKLFQFKPRLLDLPMLIWVISPFPSSITNGLGAYDGLSGVYFNAFVFGLPYYLARVYIKTPKDVKTVAIWFLIAGLIATPMALWESRMSPHLNESVYGYRVAKFHMARRLGGYRPMLFMRHGLEVGLWMASCSAVAIWLWITTGNKLKVFNFKLPPMASIILITTLMSRSLGSLILLTGTTAGAFFVRISGMRIILIALVLTPSVYLSVRLSNIWSPDQITAVIRAFDEERAHSLEARLTQELDIAQHALEQPLFGWGGHNRFRPVNDLGNVTPVDGMTTITFGKTGFFGLVSFLGFAAIPGVLMILRIKGKSITSEVWAPSVAILLAVSICSLDMMFNAFYTPLHIFGFGVIAAVAANAKTWQIIMMNQQRMMYQAAFQSMNTSSESNSEPSTHEPGNPDSNQRIHTDQGPVDLLNQSTRTNKPRIVQHPREKNI